MSSPHFTHLHIHTDFSLLDGAITVDKLVQFGKQHGMKAMGISDHGNIFGAVKFFQTCHKAGIKPVLGMEAYLTEDASIKNAQRKYYHALLIVQNEIGYKNLCKLISFAYQKGFYFKPRIDYAILAQHSEGLVITSACLGGHIPQLLMNNNDAEAERIIDWHLKQFGSERFYLEVQPEDQQEQAVLNQKLYHLSEVKGVPLVATGDCHYVTAQDRQAHEIMLAIQTQDKMSNPQRYTFGNCRVHLRTQDEMLALFKEHPSAVWNTGVIADSCTFEFQTGKLFFPKFEVPQEHTSDSFFLHLCRKGLQKLHDEKRIPAEQADTYAARLELEAELIISMGFVGYFLVVSDFIQWSKRNNIPVGPGRGSAAGSLVAWALEITNIDPIKYNLLFERFLNPERVTMPDIDIDFCIEGRENVINYIRSKYGNDKVGQIITFGTMMAKGVIKDVARALGFPFEDSNAITSLIPEQLKITLAQALEQEPRLQELLNSNPRAQQLFDIAFRLEGLTRHASKHAAGVVISPDPIDEVLPVYVPPKTDELVTQYAMTELESLGFLKIDLLGLKNLTLIDRVIKLIARTHGTQINIDALPLDDVATFQLISEGKTSGVFQLESSGLKEVLRKLQPDKFEDIIAVNALYRPGPLGSGMIDDYIERRHGRQKISYLFPELAPILEETYGVIVYQEQVMKIASTIGGYSLGQADILRRAMGKKKAEVMAEQRALFLEKSTVGGFNQIKAGELFDLMAYFAGYGFNKSHSAAYALIAYQTAYLKANYPAEFMACLISLESTNAEKMAFYLQEAREMALTIVPPNINRSTIEFDVVDGEILFGLQGIKSVGIVSLENIIAVRAEKPFVDLLDFCKRIDLRTSNKRVIEHFISAGALDVLPGNRAEKTNELGRIMDLAAEHKKAALTGQMGLFSMPISDSAADEGKAQLYQFQPVPDWSSKERLEKEKEVIGFYVSEHPLHAYRAQLAMLNVISFSNALALLAQSPTQEPMVICCGLLTSKREIVTKKGDTMAFVQVEDGTSHAEVVVFPSVFKKSHQWLGSHTIFIVKGELDISSQQACKIKARELVPLDLFFQEWPSIELASLTLPDTFDEDWVQALAQLLGKGIGKGSIPLEFIFQDNNKKLRLETKQKIVLTHDICAKLEAHQISVKLSV
ncbi:DNA polymerase III subunit alpha [Candidatus Dependentiae bacterium]|nr:DNA polymerase III subunit alpha [Candidatus Dependentiae bacterium]MCC7414562.1 DNA polymerase III subunit alpha [Campylobacterota bacterium]